jgi:CRP-like cAMP-binding protein
MPFDDTMFIKRNVDILSFFTEEQIRAITQDVDRQVFKKGQTVVFRGEINSNFNILKNGRAEVSVKNGGDTVILSTLGPGDFFGEMSLLESAPAGATIRAVEDDTVVLMIPLDTFRAFLRQNPSLDLALREKMAERRRQNAAATAKPKPGGPPAGRAPVKRIDRTDLGVGIFLTLVAMVCGYAKPTFTEIPELKLYDLRHGLLPVPAPAENLRLVKIDDVSIQAEGRWPWPRNKIAELIRRIEDGNPRVIGLGIIFTDPDENQGWPPSRSCGGITRSWWNARKKAFDALLVRAEKDARYKKLVPRRWLDRLSEFDGSLMAVEEMLDADTQLAETLQDARNLIQPFSFDALNKTLLDESPDVSARMNEQALLQSPGHRREQDGGVHRPPTQNPPGGIRAGPTDLGARADPAR